MNRLIKKAGSVVLSLVLAFSALTVSVGAVTAEQQASASKTYLYGDVNLDQKVSIGDAIVVQKNVLKAVTFSELETKIADVDSSGEITMRDAILVQKYSIKLLSEFSAGISFVVEDDTDWRTSTITYEIFVRSFCDSDGDGIGDFRGVASKASYLKELNVGCVWLMPINESPSYHGYDVMDYCSTNEDYGTIEDFCYMLDVLHQNGIKVLIDFVANHTSSQHSWFTEALSNPDGPYGEFYEISDTQGSGSGWVYNSQYKKYYRAYFAATMPDLNYKNKAVWTEMENAAGYWLDLGVDGFRLDASMHIDTDASVTHAWWQDFESYVKAKNPDAFVVGENWVNSVDTVASFFADMDSSFDFPLQSQLMGLASGNQMDIVGFVNTSLNKYAKSAATTPDIAKTSVMTTFLNNHDQTRTVSTLGSVEKAKLAAAIQFTLPGMPFIYYGEELGQKSDGNDPNRREPMDWYASATGDGMCKVDSSFWGASTRFTVANDGISLEEETGDSDSIYNYYKKLTKLRTDYPIFFSGDYTTVSSKSLNCYTVTDEGSSYGMFVAHNVTGGEISQTALSDFTDLLSGKSYKAGDTITLAPYSTIVSKYDGKDKTFSLFEAVTSKTYSITFNVTLPENTPTNDIVYIAGQFSGAAWDPANADYALTRTSATTATITKEVSGCAGDSFEFKFTRGKWDNCEVAKDGSSNISGTGNQNHVYTLTSDTAPVVEVTVARWRDLA